MENDVSKNMKRQTIRNKIIIPFNKLSAWVPVVVDLQLPKKLILEPLVKVHIVKQLVRRQPHCIVHCRAKKHIRQKMIINPDIYGLLL